LFIIIATAGHYTYSLELVQATNFIYKLDIIYYIIIYNIYIIYYKFIIYLYI